MGEVDFSGFIGRGSPRVKPLVFGFFVWVTAMNSLLFAGQVEVAEPADRPNVIFIIVDDQREKEFGFLSPETALTPNIDRLVSEGVYFQNGFATSTVCTPSRYSCLTGRYPSQASGHYFERDITEEGMTVVSFNTHVEMDRLNLPRVLQQAGYTTGLIGKWHIGVEGYREEVPPAGSDASDPEIDALLKRNQTTLSEYLKAYGFDSAERLYANNALDSRALKNTGMTNHNMEWLTEGALNFIDAHHEEPFYLYFSTTLPHYPKPIESVKGDARITAAGLLSEPIDVQPTREEVLQRVLDAGYPEEAAGSAWIDDGIGAILAKLEAHSIRENTLIIFFNDHGMENGSKSSLYDGATRTPILLNWPAKIKPQRPSAVVSSIDFVPTILEATGVDLPAELDARGESFLPIVCGEQASLSRDFAYSEIGYTRAITDAEWKYLAFRLPPSAELSVAESLRIQKEYLDEVRRKQPWIPWQPEADAKIPHTGGPPGGDFLTRLVFMSEGPFLANYHDPDQLYHLSVDPLEASNLATDPESGQRLESMKAAMKVFLNDLPGTFAELKTSP